LLFVFYKKIFNAAKIKLKSHKTAFFVRKKFFCAFFCIFAAN